MPLTPGLELRLCTELAERRVALRDVQCPRCKAMDARALSRCRGSRRSKDQRRVCALIQQALEDYPD
jgi:hypothetical protein